MGYKSNGMNLTEPVQRRRTLDPVILDSQVFPCTASCFMEMQHDTGIFTPNITCMDFVLIRSAQLDKVLRMLNVLR